MNTASSIFQKIIDRKIPADIVYEDDDVLAFKDIHPLAPVHILIIPKKSIATVNDLQEVDQLLAGKLMLSAARIAAKLGIAKDGYRLIVNCNQHGGQEVFHLHLHLIGGKSLGPMLS